MLEEEKIYLVNKDGTPLIIKKKELFRMFDPRIPSEYKSATIISEQGHIIHQEEIETLILTCGDPLPSDGNFSACSICGMTYCEKHSDHIKLCVACGIALCPQHQHVSVLDEKTRCPKHKWHAWF